MQYLLRGLLWTILVIPFVIWEFLVFIWTFRRDSIVQTWNDYSETMNREYNTARRAYRFGKPRKF